MIDNLCIIYYTAFYSNQHTIKDLSCKKFMFTQDQLQAFKIKVEAAHTIALFWHHNIDWDAIWSVLWLAWVFEKLGKKVSCFTTVAPGAYFSFVKDITTIQTTFDYGQYDLIGFLDFTWYNRIGWCTLWHEEYFNNANLFVVDRSSKFVFSSIINTTNYKCKYPFRYRYFGGLCKIFTLFT